jgi:hypothetical protein
MSLVSPDVKRIGRYVNWVRSQSRFDAMARDDQLSLLLLSIAEGRRFSEQLELLPPVALDAAVAELLGLTDIHCKSFKLRARKGAWINESWRMAVPEAITEEFAP